MRQLAADAAARKRMAAEARAEMERCSWGAATREILHDFYPAAQAAHAARTGGRSAAGRKGAVRPDAQH